MRSIAAIGLFCLLCSGVWGAFASDFETAVQLYEAGRLEESLALFRKIVSANPKDGESWLWIGTILLEKGEAKEAIGPLQQATQLNLAPALQATALVNLGIAYQTGSKELAKAIDCYEKALRVKPDLSEGHLYLIRAYLTAGQAREAHKTAERAFLSLGRPLPADKVKATWGEVLVMMSQDYDKALDVLKSLGLQQWANPEFQYLAGRANEGIHQWSRAAIFYGQAAALAPQVADYHLSLGRVLGKLGLWKEAVAPLERAVALSGNGSDASVQLGLAYGSLGRWSDAVAVVRRTLERDPQNFSALQILGWAYLGLKQDQKAMETFRSALKVKDDPVVSVNLAALELDLTAQLLVRRAFEQALTVAEEAVKRLSAIKSGNITDVVRLNLARGWRLLGKAQQGLAKEKEAQQARQQAHSLLTELLKTSKDPDVLLEMARLMVDRGAFEKAMEWCRQVLRSRPKSEDAYLILGFCAYSLRKWAGAEQAYQEALRINANSIDALMGLGLVSFEKGRYEEAASWFERVLKISPDHPIARRNLEVTRQMLTKGG
ncbi:MAG: tetratricopeptide repeat protein [Armatimonadetes bacterium]|nr:tetratricopeptide repeat protein [Armatimonadota bacterium]MDW8122375.1 tetratricopeptide repeat protein [Armatimonadota bacterium]